MSDRQRATIYDKNTGKFAGRSGTVDPAVEKARRDGHIVVTGSHSDMTKWDFTSGSIVVDLDKQQERQQKEQDDQQAKQDRIAARQWLRDNVITASNQLEALRHMQTLLK